ncbi:MAG: aminotransferase class III-fold pyridoxal phosphate-dependent enzyme [Pseudomonadota bacterium]
MYNVNSLENHWMPFTANRDFKANPRIVTGAKGIRLTDHKGGSVLDGSSGLFCTPLGHGREDIADAVRDQLLQTDYVAPFQLGHSGSFELASLVSRILPDEFNHVFFTNSGSESIDTALKMVMAYHRAKGDGQRVRMVSRERAYHGVNIGGVSLSGMVKNRETFSGVMPNVVCMRHTWNPEERFVKGQPESGAELAEDLSRMIETYGASTIAACFVEPVAGSTGCLPPPKGYLERLREICTENGILLVFDEVITGFGRLGKPFAAQVFGVTPDIITMAKALTNGCQPMGAVGVRDEIYSTITEASPENAIEFFHGYTYSGHPAACAAGIVTQKAFTEEGHFDNAAAIMDDFQDKVMELKDLDIVYDVRTCGLMSAVEIRKDGVAPGALGTEAQKKMFWNGLHIKFTGDNGIIAPAFVYTTDDVVELVDAFRKTLLEL